MSDELIGVGECARIANRSVEAWRKFAKRNGLRRAPNQGRKALYYRKEVLEILGLDKAQRPQSVARVA